MRAAQKSTNENDALIAMRGQLDDIPLVAVAFEFSFMGGSMGAVVGEKFVQAATRSLEEGIPLVCFAASGGARMQEALFSLMQMAKTSARLRNSNRQAFPISPCSPTRSTAVSPPRSPCLAISMSPSPMP